MADTLFNQTSGVEITKDIVRTSRATSLNQVLNVGLNGLIHIQNIGKASHQITVEFVIHENNDNLLYTAYENANMIKVVDDNREYYGYIISIELGNEYAEGYHTGTIIIQQEVVI